MDTSILILTLVSLAFSGFFSGTEIAFVTSNKVRVELDVNRTGIINRILNIFYSNRSMFISTLLVGNNIVLVIYGMGMAMLLEPLIELVWNNEAFVLISQTLISTGVILLGGEFLPKTVFRINPNASLKTSALPLYIFYLLLYPISWFTTKLSNLLMKVFGIKVSKQEFTGITMGELDAYIQNSIDSNDQSETNVERDVKIFQNALDFSNIHLRDCMIPRNEIVGVNIETIQTDQLSKRFTESGLSKIVVYKDDMDNIIGNIHVSELLENPQDWKKHIKPVIFAPETMFAKKMMRNLLSKKKSMAIVVDEFGGTAGLVTLEDLVEEIFGDIEDEHDRKRVQSRKIADGIYDISGRMEIEKINDNFHLGIPESDEYQTLAGYLLYNLEAIPEEGETFMINDIKYTIIKKSAAKIELVRVEIPTSEEDQK